MANRLLLTLLALLTGLAVPASAAQARGAQVSAAQQVALMVEPGTAQAPRAPVALARLPEPGLRNTRIVAPLLHDAVPEAPAVAAILTGIDRARE
ncbi:hypothetical protein HT136_04235 [Novosphingobium profundi]|nr:hypothetical protein [Novosphingobium profundi]MBT0667573.1 hypothetical protein [Novosphingobium profundi]